MKNTLIYIFKKIVLVVVISSFFYGCVDVKQRKTFYETGELKSISIYDQNGLKNGIYKEYYKTGSIKVVENYENGSLIDTSAYYNENGIKNSEFIYSPNKLPFFKKYYPNGQIGQEGYIMNDTTLIGWWNFYSESGYLDSKINYVDPKGYLEIKDEINWDIEKYIAKFPHINESIFYRQDGTIINEKSNFFNLYMEDTLTDDSKAWAFIELTPQVAKTTDYYEVFYWQEDTKGKVAHIDSTIQKLNKPAVLKLDKQIKGNMYLKGFILEQGIYPDGNNKNNDSSSVYSKIMFFERYYYSL
ncbi:toxin-antitoxin system YwqK family antitoxin [Robertkochia solimangrovi]|uniref:toxin-antitoxin system YwqK family antitoxin n=1 Tax=Robertkochia solimangrovi TaxID=2213046 RepID=UPI00117FAAD1|nr:hypothetical protein [Robertkochia solimangrovi]TRZ41650.1 hypothetical protein DMZ48_16715 [Robertkochia solimangrovi]